MTEILLVTPVTPAAAGNGLAMRAGLLLEGAARSGSVSVLVVPVFGGAAAPDGLVQRHATRFEVLALDRRVAPRADITARLGTVAGRERAAALHPLPELCGGATVAAAAMVAEAAARADAVLAMRLYLAPFLDMILDRPRRAPVILDVDDIESVTRSRLGEAAEAERYRRLEAHYLPLLDGVLAVSGADAGYLAGAHGLSRVHVVPNAVRLPETVSPPPPDGRGGALFVGNLGYQPNVEAAVWLCREVLPRLAGAGVTLAGARPAAEVRALAGPRVVVAADVPDVAPWYAAAAMATAPLRRGGGSRVKVLEALAHGRPVVATAVGAEGVGPDVHGGGVITADTPVDFAAACRRLLGDPAQAAALGRRGRAAVAATRTVPIVAARVDRAVGAILGR